MTRNAFLLEKIKYKVQGGSLQVYRVSHEQVYAFNFLSFLNPKWIIYTVCDFFLSGYLVEQVQTLSFNNDTNFKLWMTYFDTT